MRHWIFLMVPREPSSERAKFQHLAITRNEMKIIYEIWKYAS